MEQVYMEDLKSSGVSHWSSNLYSCTTYKPLELKKERQLTCRKCGAVLRKTGDNVYVCDGFAKDKDGNVVKNKDGSNKRCGYFYIKFSF